MASIALQFENEPKSPSQVWTTAQEHLESNLRLLIQQTPYTGTFKIRHDRIAPRSATMVTDLKIGSIVPGIEPPRLEMKTVPPGSRESWCWTILLPHGTPSSTFLQSLRVAQEVALRARARAEADTGLTGPVVVADPAPTDEPGAAAEQPSVNEVAANAMNAMRAVMDIVRKAHQARGEARTARERVRAIDVERVDLNERLRALADEESKLVESIQAAERFLSTEETRQATALFSEFSELVSSVESRQTGK